MVSVLLPLLISRGESSAGEPWEESRAHDSFSQHHSCFQPCPQPLLSGCIKGKLSATLSRPLAGLTVCRASSDYGDITHALLCLSPVPPPVLSLLWLLSFIPPQAYQLCCHCGFDLSSSLFHAMTQADFLFSHLQIFSTLQSKILQLITEGSLGWTSPPLCSIDCLLHLLGFQISSVPWMF